MSLQSNRATLILRVWERMKVGDLIRCVWQPRVAGVDKKTQCCLPMKHTIKGEIGLVTDVLHSKYSDGPRYEITFPQLGGYAHPLSDSAFEVLDG